MLFNVQRLSDLNWKSSSDAWDPLVLGWHALCFQISAFLKAVIGKQEMVKQLVLGHSVRLCDQLCLCCALFLAM